MAIVLKNIDILHSAMKWALSLFAMLSILMLLPSCQSIFSSPNSLTESISKQGDTRTPATVAAAARPVDPIAPGAILFILTPSQVGNYAGWQFEVAAAERNKGFIPFITDPLNAGYSLRAGLWPDRYQVRVHLLRDIELDQWIDVGPGEVRVVYIDIGFLFNNLSILSASESRKRANELAWPMKTMTILQTYQPLRISLGSDLEARYTGPQQGGNPIGHGPARIYKMGVEIAEMSDAIIQHGKLTGDVAFKDGRSVDNIMNSSHSFPKGTRMTWPDGKSFEGSYEGLAPSFGTMSFANGMSWTGSIVNEKPVGIGRVTQTDGITLDKVPGIDSSKYNGTYPCTATNQSISTCYYFNGEKISTEAEYVARKEQANKKAQAAAKVQDTAKSKPLAPQAPESTEVNGCTKVEGQFSTDNGLSKLTLDGQGSGHLWQHTYVDTETYTMDIDFTYSGTQSSMTFKYEPAQYRNAAGALIRTIPVPGGTGKCAYDGRYLDINGKTYARN